MFKFIALLLGTIAIEHGVCLELNSMVQKPPASKEKEKQRIAIVGDSLTTGFLRFVGRDHLFSS